MKVLDALKKELLDSAVSFVRKSSHDMPEEFTESMLSAVSQEDHIELSLLACASSVWCGADIPTGMPVAMGSLMLRAGIGAHLSACGLGDVFAFLEGADISDETVAILAGDGLMALSMEYLAGNCGRHSAVVVAEAVKAMGARGMLEGMSLALDDAAGMKVTVPDGRSVHELYTGQQARFSAMGGAMMAGASGIMLDDAAQIGLLTGRARYLWSMAEATGDRDRKKDLVFQARTMIEEAQSILGHSRSTSLFTSLMYLSDFF